MKQETANWVVPVVGTAIVWVWIFVLMAAAG